MGIGFDSAWFLSNCLRNINSSLGEVDFSRTITLGRQCFALSRRECEKLFNNILALSATQKTQFYKDLDNSTTPRFPRNKYSEPFFKLLHNGTDTVVDSLDCSDYETATVIHDITIPIPCELKNKYTCVFDGGLLEHVFNYPVALKNAMDMVKVGGHLILVTPGNNFFGHGFYQFSPELFYSILREENGYIDTLVYLNKSSKWYLVQNPRDIHKRSECSPKWSDALLYVISTRVGEVPDKLMAYQSDYEDKWTSQQTNSNKQRDFETILKIIYHHIPPDLGKPLHRLYLKLFYIKRFKELFHLVDFS